MTTHDAHLGTHLGTHLGSHPGTGLDEPVRDPELSGMLLLVGLVAALLVLVILTT
jgi:hypothetical protein